MKTLITTTILLLTLLLTVNTHAQNTWVISNNPTFEADFSRLIDACESSQVQAGDILLVQGSGTSYGNDTINKPVVVIGPGNYFGASENVQVYSYMPATFGQINILDGGQGAYLSGTKSNRIDVETDEVIVQRNSMGYLYISGNNIVMTQNYISNICCITQDSNNLLISSNYILNFGKSNNSINMDCVVEYNVINYNGATTSSSTAPVNSAFRNNIINNVAFSEGSGFNNTFSHNIIVSSGPSLNGVSGNQVVSDWSSLFVGSTGNSTDGQWQLSESSEALGAGINGVDCGMFGGSEPYVLNGVPAIPQIYEFFTPTSATSNGLDVHLKARSNQ